MLNRLLFAGICGLVLCATPVMDATASDEPAVIDRHDEMSDPAIEPPAWPDYLPVPLHEQDGETFQIVLENWVGGAIYTLEYQPSGAAAAGAFTAREVRTAIGEVISPVTAVNPRGFTASGWGEIGTVCASAVNAIHVKTDHDYGLGRGTIFSILPIEQAKVDPNNYKSYISHGTSLQTDIPGGQGIFGGGWAPLVGSELQFRNAASKGGDLLKADPGWVPAVDEVIVLEVTRKRYNPEYVEFENAYGGLIWIKELGRDPYPIGQVLKPVVGIGRFLGTQYAGTGRIRAAHPGVICISTSPDGIVGGFQIIPRDHAMSREMIYTRYKTQWMVVGPLWALDPSWEGLPPLFSDYLYPSYIPSVIDGEPNDAVSAMEIYLSRFTVRGRYADADDPEMYRILNEETYLDHYALKNLTHLRIYFPVNLKLATETE